MQHLLMLGALVLVIAPPNRASAQALIVDGDLVVLALPGRTGSISATGSTPAVTVRWDVTEGAFPEGLVSFELLRDNALIATLPYVVSDATTIEALYASPDNDRRWLELLGYVPEMSTDLSAVDATDVSEAIYELLTTDSYWAYFVARLDPTIAVARGLAYIDTTATGTVEYRLRGVLAATDTLPERTVLLGVTEVDTAALAVAPAAIDFEQISVDDFRRCDAPEAMKAHGVIALDWQIPGAGAADRFGVSMMIAGWDIYRTRQPITGPTAAPRDIRAEAATLPHDERGQVHLDGLAKVTDVPVLGNEILVEMEMDNQTAWAPRSARYLATEVETRAAGMRPGESYGYYLVARDVTGNYGETAAIVVQVPDLLAPPTPWNVHTVRRPTLHSRGAPTPDTMIIRWPHVDLLNFVEDHSRRSYCNLEDAKFTRELSFVSAPSCPDPGGSGPVRVSLRVDHYDVYRFASPHEASGFTDADGDGASDRDERTPVGGPPTTSSTFPTLTRPGSACDPDDAPPTATRYKFATVSAADAIAGADGRLHLDWSGVVAPEDAGRVFWYRIVAVAEGGARSPMSAPVRAVFPAYRETAKRWIDPPEECTESIVISDCDSGAGPAGTDTTGDAATVRYSCGNHEWVFDLVPDGGTSGDLVTRDWTDQECGDHPNSLNDLCDGHPLHIQFFDGDGLLIAEETIPFNDGVLCRCAVLSEDCFDPPPYFLPGGFEPVPYDPDSECLAVYRRIGDRLQRIEVICDTLVTDFTDYYASDLLGGTICLYTAAQGPNGMISPKVPLGCEEIAEAAAEVPQVAGLSFPGTTTALLRIIPPEQPVLGFVAELVRADGSARYSTFVQLGERGVLGDVSEEIDIGPAPAAGVVEEWCLRARTVISRTAAAEITDSLSDWSPETCASRTAQGTPPPAYIPWPTLPTPLEGLPLHALYLDGDGLPIVHLVSLPDMCDDNGFLQYHARCVGQAEGAGDEIPACYYPISPLESSECPGSCAEVEAALVSRLRFVAYRQSRVLRTSTSSDFVQVSPLIELAHCDGFLQDELPLPAEVFNGIANGKELDILADPYVALAEFSGTDDGDTVAPWNGLELYFIDRYPHTEDLEYRYQFVYFDARGEPSSFRTSDWIEAER